MSKRNEGPLSASAALGKRLEHFDKVLTDTLREKHELQEEIERLKARIEQLENEAD